MTVSPEDATGVPLTVVTVRVPPSGSVSLPGRSLMTLPVAGTLASRVRLF